MGFQPGNKEWMKANASPQKHKISVQKACANEKYRSHRMKKLPTLITFKGRTYRLLFPSIGKDYSVYAEGDRAVLRDDSGHITHEGELRSIRRLCQ